MRPDRLRTDPAMVRLALAWAERHGDRAARDALGVSDPTLKRWQRTRAATYPDWPALDMDAPWLARREARRKKADELARYRRSRYLNRGPLLVDATGTRRRIQALMALGWTAQHIAERGPWGTCDGVLEMVKRTKVTVANRAIVAGIYDELCMTLGPSAANRRRALREGWPPPLAFDDIDRDPEPATGEEDDGYDAAVVERVLGGEWRMHASAAERTEICRRWCESGRSLHMLGQLAGWKPERHWKVGA